MVFLSTKFRQDEGEMDTSADLADCSDPTGAGGWGQVTVLGERRVIE